MKFLKKAMRECRPLEGMVTGLLCPYATALKEIGAAGKQHLVVPKTLLLLDLQAVAKKKDVSVVTG